MSTETQISANRLNAQKSTGPKTPEGKEKVSQNAVTHGLTALRPVLANENPEEYALFRDDFFRNYAPAGILEESLAQRAADSFWRLQRAQDYETAVLNTLIESAQIENLSPRDDNNPLGQILLDDFRQTHCLEKVQKYEMAIERSFYRTVKELRRLQSLRLGQDQGKQGLVRSVAKQVVPVPALPAQNKQNSAIEQNKPKIPPFDPIKLLENCITNPIGLDPLTKIMMKSDRDRRLAKKAM